MEERLKIFKALGDSTRLKIIEFLLDGEKCVCEIFPHVKRTQSTVSIQLGKLESWGILKSRKEGRRFYYKIENENVDKIFSFLKEDKK